MSTADKTRPVEEIVGRPCTCHPHDKAPKPCARMYALTACRERELVERDRFEHWMSDGGKWPKAVERSGGAYKLMQSQSSWDVWKARAYLTPSAPLWDEPECSICRRRHGLEILHECE